MLSAHKKLTKRNQQLNLGVALLSALCFFFLLIGATTLATQYISAGDSNAISGYVSQEKRFLMYLFNGNEGKVQIA